MKTKFLFSIVLALFFIFNIHLPTAFAQDYTTWNLPKGAKARLGKGIVNDIVYTPDGTRLEVVSGAGIWIYDVATGEALDLLTGHTERIRRSVAFSPDGQTFASGDYKTINLWDAKTGQHKKTLIEHTGQVYSVAFSPDGQTLASGSGDGTVLLWHVTPMSTTHNLEKD